PVNQSKLPFQSSILSMPLCKNVMVKNASKRISVAFEIKFSMVYMCLGGLGVQKPCEFYGQICENQFGVAIAFHVENGCLQLFHNIQNIVLVHKWRKFVQVKTFHMDFGVYQFVCPKIEQKGLPHQGEAIVQKLFLHFSSCFGNLIAP